MSEAVFLTLLSSYNLYYEIKDLWFPYPASVLLGFI